MPTEPIRPTRFPTTLPKLLLTAGLYASLGAGLATAGPAGHGAHVHGMARLDVAVDGNRVLIDLDSPLDNLLGFEHSPRNAREREAVAAMAAQLRTPAPLFRFDPEARCVATGTRLTSAALPAGLLNPGAAPGAQPTSPGHGDLEAEFSFDCAAPPRNLEVGLFAAFPQLHRIDVQAVGPSGQSATQLTPKAPRLPLP